MDYSNISFNEIINSIAAGVKDAILESDEFDFDEIDSFIDEFLSDEHEARKQPIMSETDFLEKMMEIEDDPTLTDEQKAKKRLELTMKASGLSEEEMEEYQKKINSGPELIQKQLDYIHNNPDEVERIFDDLYLNNDVSADDFEQKQMEALMNLTGIGEGSDLGDILTMGIGDMRGLFMLQLLQESPIKEIQMAYGIVFQTIEDFKLYSQTPKQLIKDLKDKVLEVINDNTMNEEEQIKEIADIVSDGFNVPYDDVVEQVTDTFESYHDDVY